jgi:stage II sporulation protein AA (anti-sigma F factor antagonist)
MEGDCFEAKIVRCGGMAIVECAGSIEQSDNDRLWAALYDAILVNPRVVVDLSEVTFLDPTGLNELVHASRVLSRLGGGKLTLRGARGPVARLLDVTDTSSEFRIVP